MAKQKARQAVGVVLALVIAGVLVGYVLPIGIGAVNSDQTVTTNQSVGNSVEVAPGLNSTVTSATDGTSATVELTDTTTNSTQTVSNTVSVGSSETYQMNGGNVTVTVDSATSSSADVTYQLEQEYGWGDGASAIYGLMPLFFVLVPLVVVVGWAMRSM